MAVLATVLVVLVALLHGYILVLEMFLWRTPRGMRALRILFVQAVPAAIALLVVLLAGSAG